MVVDLAAYGPIMNPTLSNVHKTEAAVLVTVTLLKLLMERFSLLIIATATYVSKSNLGEG